MGVKAKLSINPRQPFAREAISSKKKQTNKQKTKQTRKNIKMTRVAILENN